MIFVDTGAWVALENPADTHHKKAASTRDRILGQKTRLTTSCFVLDETYTLLLYRVGFRKAVGFRGRIKRMEQSGLLEIVHLGPTEEDQAWAIFETFNRDKSWSFTDCTSKALCDRRGIRRVFAFDLDFNQMGFSREPLPA